MLKYLFKRRAYRTRAPTLNTVLMIEETLKRADGTMTVAELRRTLPRQVMHQTLIAVIDYLEYSGKVTIHDNKILWTANDSPQLKGARMNAIKVR